MRRAFFVRRLRRLRRLRMRRHCEASRYGCPRQCRIAQAQSAKSAKSAGQHCAENHRRPLAKVVGGFSRSDVAHTGSEQACEQGVFAKRGRILFAGGLTAKAADYFRKRERRIRLQGNATPDIRRLNWRSQSSMPDIRRPDWQLPVAMPDIRCPDWQLPVAMPDIRRPDWQLPVAMPDIRRASGQLPVAMPDVRCPDWQLPVGPLDLFDHVSRHKMAIFSHQTPVFS